jgi:nickel-dependent lactate racemase
MSDALMQRIDPAGLDDAAIHGFVAKAVGTLGLKGKSVLCIVPDNTRSVPMPLLFRVVCDALQGATAKLDFLIALGTHPPMSETEINTWFGLTPSEREADYADVAIFNHAWQNPDELAVMGRIEADEMRELSRGMLTGSVDVVANKRVLDYDHILLLGPVFPHEVAGFSGGNKYFFPGVSGPDVLHLFHWLGALITNPAINGEKYTPVRAVIDKSASLIPTPRTALCLNALGKKTLGLYFGSPETAWDAAADAAAETHIRYMDRSYARVLALCPTMYTELWVAAKCMYKLEPIVADGGELIIYAPHLKEVSAVHGDWIRRIGYHTRDYFLAQMERFTDVPGGILAHSTHVRGIGSYEDGIERPRITVTLATALSEADCHSVNLAYRDPASIDVEAWRSGEDDTLVVDHAGEILHRLKDAATLPAGAV